MSHVPSCLFLCWDIEGANVIDFGSIYELLKTFKPQRTINFAWDTQSQDYNTFLRFGWKQNDFDIHSFECLLSSLFTKGISLADVIRQKLPNPNDLDTELILDFEKHALKMFDFTHSISQSKKCFRAVWGLYKDCVCLELAKSAPHPTVDQMVSSFRIGIPASVLVSLVQTVHPFKNDPDVCIAGIQKVIPAFDPSSRATLKDFQRIISILLSYEHWGLLEFFSTVHNIRQSLYQSSLKYPLVNHKVVGPSHVQGSGERMKRFELVFRHALDSCTRDSVGEFTRKIKHPDWIQLACAPICILLKIEPVETWQSDWRTALCEKCEEFGTDYFLKLVRAITLEQLADSVSRNDVRRFFSYLYNPAFNQNFLQSYSPFLSDLCSWATVAVNWLCCKRGWVEMSTAEPLPTQRSLLPLLENTSVSVPRHRTVKYCEDGRSLELGWNNDLHRIVEDIHDPNYADGTVKAEIVGIASEIPSYGANVSEKEWNSGLEDSDGVIIEAFNENTGYTCLQRISQLSPAVHTSNSKNEFPIVPVGADSFLNNSLSVRRTVIHETSSLLSGMDESCLLEEHLQQAKKSTQLVSWGTALNPNHKHPITPTSPRTKRPESKTFHSLRHRRPPQIVNHMEHISPRKTLALPKLSPRSPRVGADLFTSDTNVPLVEDILVSNIPLPRSTDTALQHYEFIHELNRQLKDYKSPISLLLPSEFGNAPIPDYQPVVAAMLSSRF